MDYNAIGQRIRAYRKKAGLSQEALAERVWISTTHMSHIETGSTKLSLSVLSDLSEELRVSTDEILFGSRQFGSVLPREDILEIIAECSDQQLECIYRLIKSFD